MIKTNAWSMSNVKDNHKRGDFYFRDVYKRNTYSSFTGIAYSDSSTLYIDETDQATPCTSQVSTYDDGVSSLHLYTRNQADFDKGNVLQAAVSINAHSTTFRSTNTHVAGALTAKATLTVNGNITQTSGTASLQDVNVAGNLTVNGSTWASTVVYSTTTPFLYTGPGVAYGNGVSFYTQTRANGTPFVTGGGLDNSVFTFITGGTYMLQAEIGVSYPWMPDGDIDTFYVVNGNANERFGMDSHARSNFSCTRPYLLTVDANDNVRFILYSSSGNDYEVGLSRTRLTMLKLG